MLYFSNAWLMFAMDVSLKALLLAAAAGIVLLAVRLRDTNLRHRVWTGVLAGMLALPILVCVTPAVPLPGWLTEWMRLAPLAPETPALAAVPLAPLPSPPIREPRLNPPLADFLHGEPAQGAFPDPAFTAPRGSDNVTPVTTSLAPPPDSVATETPALESSGWSALLAANWQSVVASIYFAVAAFFLLRLLAGIFFTRRLIGRATLLQLPAILALPSRKNLRFLESPSIHVPLTIGVLRPVVLLPVGWREWSETKLQAVLAHELAHVRRADWLVMALAELNIALYWFHPVAWFLKHRLSELAERNCDDAVLAADGDRTQYARYLLEVAASLSQAGARYRPPRHGVAMARQPSVETRIDAILDTTRPLARRLSARVILGLLVIGIPCVLLAAALQPGREKGGDEGQVEINTPASPKPVVGKTESAPAGPPAAVDNIPTIGDDDVEPIEITGQVLDVDGKPAAKSSVRISGLYEGSPRKWSVESPADQEGRFHFRVRSKASLSKYKLSASNSDNSQLGFHRFPYRGNYPELAKNVLLKLSPSRVVRLKVVDKAGIPIENAKAAIFFEGFITSDVIPSDAAGIARFTIPANEPIKMAIAWKDNSGLEYHRFDEKPFAADGNETLILEGAAPVAFKIVDDNGMPVKNMEVYPWHLQSKSQNVMFNLSLFNRAFIANTDEQGIVKFAWFPTWQTATEFWLKAPGFTDQRVVYTPGKDGGQKEFVVPKNVPVRGHVRDADGKPVAGAKVQADGAGHIADRGYATAVTDKDGAYELWVLPNQIYLVTATAPGLAAAPQTGFAVLPGQPVEGKDFTLRKATRIFGRVLDQTTQEPLKNQSLVLAQQGTGLRFIKDVKLPNPYDTRWDVTPTKYYHISSDTQGRFELFVGDGDYVYPQQKQNFHIAGEAEREFTLKVDLQKTKTIFFMGVVREKSTNTRSGLAKITSRAKDGSALGEIEENANREGDFSTERAPTAAYLHAVSNDKNLKAILEITEQQPRAVLYLEPVGTIRGRLLKPDTKEPWSRKWVQFAAVLPNSTEKGSTQYYAGWGGEVLTGEDGKFEKIWLVPNWKYRMELKDNFTEPGTFLGEVTVSPGETKDLGDVTPLPLPKPNPPEPPKPEPAAPPVAPKPEVGKTEPAPAK